MRSPVETDRHGKARTEQPGEAWKWLCEGVAKGDAIVADTYLEESVVERGLMPIHAYSVVGAEERGDKRFVTLRNPAPYLAELENNPDVAEEMRQDPNLARLADILTGKGLDLKSLKYGTFTIPFEDYYRCFDVAFRAPVK